MQCGFAVGLFPFSLWSVSHSEMRLHSVHFYFFHFSMFIVADIVLAPAFRKTFTTWVCFFYSPLFALFCFPFLPKPLTYLPNLPFSHIPPNRRQYTVAHLYRCKLQHGHQWYVSKLSLLPPSCPQRMSGSPLHDIVMMRPLMGLYIWKMSLSVLAYCMKMIAYLSYSSLLCCFMFFFILFISLCFRSLWWKFKYDL